MSVKYGLRIVKTGKILEVRSERYHGDGVSHSHYLDECGTEIWLVDNYYQAEYVRNNSTECYNAEYDTPCHGYEKEDLEVIRYVVLIESVPEEEIQKIPTYPEYLKTVCKNQKEIDKKLDIYRNVPFPKLYLHEIEEYFRLKKNTFVTF